MKRRARRRSAAVDRDTLRPEYDFSRAVRGVTAARYAEGANVVGSIPRSSTCFRMARRSTGRSELWRPSFGRVGWACGEAPNFGMHPTAFGRG